GITRLTDSGLSMTDYKLITETIPPLNEEAWNAEFERYKQFPEYQKLHSHFELEDFKQIYFWEWFHRFIGRFIGIVFIVPFLYFLFTKQLSSSTIKKSLVLLALGRSEEHTSELQSRENLVCRLLLEKKKNSK